MTTGMYHEIRRPKPMWRRFLWAVFAPLWILRHAWRERTYAARWHFAFYIGLSCAIFALDWVAYRAIAQNWRWVFAFLPHLVLAWVAYWAEGDEYQEEAQ